MDRMYRLTYNESETIKASVSTQELLSTIDKELRATGEHLDLRYKNLSELYCCLASMYRDSTFVEDHDCLLDALKSVENELGQILIQFDEVAEPDCY